jgi:hypothetical protein
VPFCPSDLPVNLVNTAALALGSMRRLPGTLRGLFTSWVGVERIGPPGIAPPGGRGFARVLTNGRFDWALVCFGELSNHGVTLAVSFD